MTSKPVHYVDNAKFLQDIKDYRAACEKAESEGKTVPRVPESIAAAIMKIANKLSYSPNFYPLSYKEDMVGDGILNCIRIVRNFDPSKSSNPFAYFTQCIYYAFLRRIEEEKREDYVRHKARKMHGVDFLSLNETDDLGEFDVQVPMDNDRIDAFIEQFEARIARRLVKRTATKPKAGVEQFIEDQDETCAHN